MIQGRVIQVPQGVSLGQVLNPVVDNRFINYIQNSYQETFQKIGNVASEFAGQVTNLFNYFTSNEYINAGKSIIQNNGMRNEYIIHEVNCENITDPGMTMRGYIMANPTLWDMYSKFQINGYNDEFILNDIATQDPYKREEYLNVVDGVVQLHNDGWEVKYLAVENDNPLTTKEKILVLDAWDCALETIASGIDPTDLERKSL